MGLLPGLRGGGLGMIGASCTKTFSYVVFKVVNTSNLGLGEKGSGARSPALCGLPPLDWW
ncbi:unnamed protein product [Prunus armeniaca]